MWYCRVSFIFYSRFYAVYENLLNKIGNRGYFKIIMYHNICENMQVMQELYYFFKMKNQNIKIHPPKKDSQGENVDNSILYLEIFKNDKHYWNANAFGTDTHA